MKIPWLARRTRRSVPTSGTVWSTSSVFWPGSGTARWTTTPASATGGWSATPRYFLAVLDSVVRDLRALEPLDRRIAARQEAAAGGGSETVTTSLKRELMFLSSHTIHHIAIMLLLAERARVAVPCELGVAFSTESFMRRANERPGS